MQFPKFPFKIGVNGGTKLRHLIAYFYVLIVASSIVRLVILVFLPSTPSSLGPDEMTYAQLAQWVAEKKSVDAFVYGPSLYNVSKTFTLPSAFLIQLGLPPLAAVRVTSMLFGILSIVLFIALCWRFLLGKNRNLNESIEFRKYVEILSVTFIFAFFPSHLLWSVIGMRETSVEFFLLLATFLIGRVCEEDFRRRYFSFNILGVILSVTLAFGTRPESAFVFALSMSLGLSLLFYRDRDFKKLLVVSCVIAGALFGHLYSATPKVEVQQFLVPKLLETSNPVSTQPSETSNPVSTQPSETSNPVSTQPSETSIPVSTQPSETSNPVSTKKINFRERCLGQVVGFAFEMAGQRYTCAYEQRELKQIDANQAFISEVSKVAQFEYKTRVYQLYASSALPPIDCMDIDKFSQKIQCFFKSLTYRYLSVLIRPLPILDTESNLQILASLENIFWLFLFLNAAKTILKRRHQLHILGVPLIIFLILYTSGMAFAEGNLGTAFRHKSTILFVLLLLVRINLNSGPYAKLKGLTCPRE
jgi:hypothetical protein